MKLWKKLLHVTGNSFFVSDSHFPYLYLTFQQITNQSIRI